MSQEIQAGIRIQAKELLDLGEVQCVIGFERGPNQGRVRPAFVRDPNEVERLVWDQECHHNLTVYLREQVAPSRRRDQPPRVAIVARPCDVRALNVLLHEGQVARESVFVIGVACPGMVDGDGPAEHCQRCKERVPVFYDALVGKPPQAKVAADDWEDITALEAMTPAQRLAFWSQEFERCIRCYACRQACPGCYCFECLAEQIDPPWISIAHGLSEKAFFHVMRAYHLAGRCVECHACDQACPMHIPLSLLNRKIAKEVEALFGYTAGDDPDIPPPLATFRKDEELPL
jgi:ferredoxin